MAAKKLSKKHVDSSEYARYLQAGESLFVGATQAVADSNSTAAAVLIVHAAIAYTDAVTIKFGSTKSTGDQHGQATYLIRQLLHLSAADEQAIARFDKLIAEKTKVSYTGLTPSPTKTASMLKDLARYRDWAKKKLG